MLTKLGLQYHYQTLKSTSDSTSTSASNINIGSPVGIFNDQSPHSSWLKSLPGFVKNKYVGTDDKRGKFTD